MKKKVCLYIGTLSLGGIGKLMLHLMEDFKRRGIEVDVFLMKGGGEYMSQIPKDISVIVEEGSYIRRVYKYLVYLFKEKPDFSVSARQRQDIINIFCCLITFFRTKPVVTIHTNVTIENKEQKCKSKDNVFVKSISKFLYRFCEKFVAVSAGVAKDFSMRTNISEDNIKVIYNPVYKEYIEAPLESLGIHPMFETLNENNQDYIIGVGRLTQQKDFGNLINAFSIIRKKRNLKLIILGDGPLKITLKEHVKSLELENEVLFFGFVPNPQFYIKRSKCFILSSKWEGFGNAIVEALGVGIPVVSTDCPSGPGEILLNGKIGLLVPVSNPQKLAQAIEETLNDPIPSEVLIERAKDFEVSKIADEYFHYIFN